MSIRIIIDSTTDIPEQVLHQVEVVPLTVSFGDEEYLDGIDLSRGDFYRKLEAGQILPKTSQPSPEAFAEVFQRIHEAGDEGVFISVASALSGTCQSAAIAAADYPEISVVDSRNVAVGTGILAEYALLLISRGITREELTQKLEKKREDICLIAGRDPYSRQSPGRKKGQQSAGGAGGEERRGLQPADSSGICGNFG